MGPIAATLLCYMEPEKVYALLALLHDNYRTHSIFLPGFPGLLEAIYVQERLMERMLPGVYGAFVRSFYYQISCELLMNPHRKTIWYPRLLTRPSGI